MDAQRGWTTALLFSAVLLVGGFLALSPDTRADAEDNTSDDVVWERDLAVATQRAFESKRPLFVVFRCEP
jgi:hypothetical protein